MERHHQQTDPGLPANFDATMAWSATITKRTCQAYRKGSSSSKVAAIVSGGRHNETVATRLRGPARLSLLSVSNQRCYAARHGYTYHRLTHNFLHASECIACREAAERAGRKKAQGKKPLNGMWNKQFHLKYALDAAPMGTWVLWVEAMSCLRIRTCGSRIFSGEHVVTRHAIQLPPSPRMGWRSRGGHNSLNHQDLRTNATLCCSHT